MKTKDIIDIFPSIREIMGDCCIVALGGYPSLVAQGILKDTRETKDFDITVFSNKKYVSNVFYNINDNIINSTNRFYNNEFQLRFNENKKIKSLSIDEEDAPVKTQYEKLNNMLGIHKSRSISISIIEKKKSPSSILPNIIDIIDLNSEEIVNLVNKNYSYIYGKHPSAERETMRIVENLISMKKKLQDFEFKNSGQYRLFKWMNDCGIKNINLDIFLMDISRLNKSSINIDGNLYLSYYPILKAKYEYCLNWMTDLESFNKHFSDLLESYKYKHIKGVNCPEDLEFLAKNREENEDVRKKFQEESEKKIEERNTTKKIAKEPIYYFNYTSANLSEEAVNSIYTNFRIDDIGLHLGEPINTSRPIVSGGIVSSGENVRYMSYDEDGSIYVPENNMANRLR